MIAPVVFRGEHPELFRSAEKLVHLFGPSLEKKEATEVFYHNCSEIKNDDFCDLIYPLRDGIVQVLRSAHFKPDSDKWIVLIASTSPVETYTADCPLHQDGDLCSAVMYVRQEADEGGNLRWRTTKDNAESEQVLKTPTGTIAVFDGMTWHGGEDHVGKERRLLIAWWFEPLE